jgi:predicted NUDIX family NTP pyrophosphohydrolase
MQAFPEVDRAGWFSIEEAREKLNPAQAEFLVRLPPP